MAEARLAANSTAVRWCEPLTEYDLKSLCDALIRCCEDYNADEALRAMASAMITILIGTTPDRAAARDALERLVWIMHDQVQGAARPAGAAQQ